MDSLENHYAITLHYRFRDDDKHYIDAWRQNACEREFLSISRHLLEVMKIDGLKVYSTPRKEGSFITEFLLNGLNDIIYNIIAEIIIHLVISGFKNSKTDGFIKKLQDLFYLYKQIGRNPSFDVEQAVKEILSKSHNFRNKSKRLINNLRKSKENDDNPIQSLEISFSGGKEEYKVHITGNLRDLQINSPNFTLNINNKNN